MQPTYYERLLADQRCGLATILDEDIARLRSTGSPEIPAIEHPTLAQCRGRYVRGAIDRFKQVLASSMSSEQFQRFQQTPSYHEALVQKATQQYWIYETFLYLRSSGERTLHLGADVCRELLAAPLEAYGGNLRLGAPAIMLVFDSAELVDAFYAGERRNGPGRHHREASLCVLALELGANSKSRGRHLKLLSIHGDNEQDYRVELRQLFLADKLLLEDILEAAEQDSWQGSAEVEQLIGLPAPKLIWASRQADSGFYAAKTAYYRAVLGALHCAETAPQRLSWHPSQPSNAQHSTLAFNELLPSGG
ncbi:MAG TPA: hypothetical protein VEK05_16310 [Burkholderiales bacterium]|nr:hypothetical protein [Burkholderiales bacterium]